MTSFFGYPRLKDQLRNDTDRAKAAFIQALSGKGGLESILGRLKALMGESRTTAVADAIVTFRQQEKQVSAALQM